jgi:hypothetical protein
MSSTLEMLPLFSMAAAWPNVLAPPLDQVFSYMKIRGEAEEHLHF